MHTHTHTLGCIVLYTLYLVTITTLVGYVCFDVRQGVMLVVRVCVCCCWCGVWYNTKIFTAISMFVSSLILYVGTLTGAKLMHDQLLKNVMRAPTTQFFDITPVGRILSRFSKDVDVVDNVIPMTLRGWIACFSSVRFICEHQSCIIMWFLI